MDSASAGFNQLLKTFVHHPSFDHSFQCKIWGTKCIDVIMRLRENDRFSSASALDYYLLFVVCCLLFVVVDVLFLSLVKLTQDGHVPCPCIINTTVSYTPTITERSDYGWETISIKI